MRGKNQRNLLCEGWYHLKIYYQIHSYFLIRVIKFNQRFYLVPHFRKFFSFFPTNKMYLSQTKGIFQTLKTPPFS